MKKIIIGIVAGLVVGLAVPATSHVLGSSPQSPGGQGSRSDHLFADLTGPELAGGTPHGIVEFEERGGDGSRNLEGLISVPGFDGDALNIYLNGTPIGQSLAIGSQTQEVELDTRDGSVVPDLKAGDEIELRDEEGTAVLSATFELDDRAHEDENER